MLQVSLGLRNLFLNQTRDALALGAIYVYTGAQPDTAELPPTGDLVAIISNNGGAYNATTGANGLRIINSGSGFLVPDPSQTWVMRGVAAGVAGWARFVAKNDTAAYSTSQPRIDCGVNSDDTGLFFSDPNIAVGVQRVVDYWIYGIPPFAGNW